MIEMTVLQDQATSPVTILQVQGKLDGSNYEALIAEAQTLFNAGTRDLVLDLNMLTYLSSAGLSALHRVALIFQGRKSADLEEGWNAFHAIDRDRASGAQKHVKLLNPTREVEKILEMVGFTNFFEIHTDLYEALDSFKM
jgi:anti-anti-sigma regulatory factor